jgi:hypothetical protein
MEEYMHVLVFQPGTRLATLYNDSATTNVLGFPFSICTLLEFFIRSVCITYDINCRFLITILFIHPLCANVPHFTIPCILVFSYFDKISSDFSNPIEAKAFSLASQLPFVQIYDTSHLNLIHQSLALEHCIHTAHLERKAEWILDFDIDEVFAFGHPIVTQNCDHEKEALQARELSNYIAQVPQSVHAIILPRLSFGQNGVKVPPPNSSQMQLYTRRSDQVSHGKLMRRTISFGREVPLSKHNILSKGRDSVIYSNGKPAHLSGNCTEDMGLCFFEFAESDFAAGESVSFPRLLHYTSRSLEDCTRKTADVNATWRGEQAMSDWRLLNAEYVCDESLDVAVEDYSVYCASKQVREELSQLFPSFDNEPRVY